MVRLLGVVLIGLAASWWQMLLFLALVSLVIGNLAAIMQTNIKRMLAFSTIAQMAFVFIALASAGILANIEQPNINPAIAVSSALYYVLGYVLTSLVTFGVLLLLARQGYESDNISDLAGLSKSSPLYAALLAISLFSLAGIPPTLGFYTKFVVLHDMLSTATSIGLWVVIFAVIMSLIGAFYYLRIVKVMYFDPPNNDQPLEKVDIFTKVLLCINGILVLFLGIFPNIFIEICVNLVN